MRKNSKEIAKMYLAQTVGCVGNTTVTRDEIAPGEFKTVLSLFGLMIAKQTQGVHYLTLANHPTSTTIEKLNTLAFVAKWPISFYRKQRKPWVNVGGHDVGPNFAMHSDDWVQIDPQKNVFILMDSNGQIKETEHFA